MAVAFSSKVLDWVRTLNTFKVAGGCHRHPVVKDATYYAGNGLQRMNQYLCIERESTSDAQATPPDGNWPKDGKLEVVNLKAYYDKNHEVLKGITFKAGRGERIGIVGRTGSGKSTLLLALLRCIQTNGGVPIQSVVTSSHEGPATDKSGDAGDVWYSGTSIFSLSLSTLRKNVTIIPQTPELFFGTIRNNIDPFSQYNEGELMSALLSAQGLDGDPREEFPDQLTLDKEVSPGGENLSAGQRQIIALARAIIRKSKLLIMDEATSSIVDYESSDTSIQNLIHKHLGPEVTVITVAHRLTTIKDYPKVLVLDGGKQVEFGDLRQLLQDDQSHFSKLVNAAPHGDRELFRSAVLYPDPRGSPRSSLDSDRTMV